MVIEYLMLRFRSQKWKAEKNFGSPTHSNVSLFDAAFPGTLPVSNCLFV